MNPYLPDTHALIWYEAGDPKLSPAARQAFAQAEGGTAVMVAHPIVLAGFYGFLHEVKQDGRFVPYVLSIRANPAYRFEPVSVDDIQRLADFDDIPEMHDRLIAVTAARLGVPIITRDALIRRSSKVRCLW